MQTEKQVTGERTVARGDCDIKAINLSDGRIVYDVYIPSAVICARDLGAAIALSSQIREAIERAT
jgi:hypothetical protein